MDQTDRRRFLRVKIEPPIRAAVGATRVYVEDASIGGIRVIHKAPLPDPGEVCRVDLPSDVGPIHLDCEVVRTVYERALYHSGMQIVAAADRQSAERLRTFYNAKLPPMSS